MTDDGQPPARRRGVMTILDRERLEELADNAHGLPEAENARCKAAILRDLGRLTLAALARDGCGIVDIRPLGTGG